MSKNNSTIEKIKEVVSTLPDFAEDFFNNMQLKGRSDKTVLQYAYDMSNFFTWLKDNKYKNIDIKKMTAHELLDNLNAKDIQRFQLSAQTYKDNVNIKTSKYYQARRASSLRTFYTYFYTNKLIENSMSEFIEVTKIPDHEPVVLNEDMVKRMLEAVNDTSGMSTHQLGKYQKTQKRDYAILKLFFSTGIRVSELCNIDVDDIDTYKYSKETDLVRASIIITRKGGNEASIPIGEDTLSALQDYIENGRERLFKETIKGKDGMLMGKPDDEPALFISLQRKRLSVRSVEQIISNYASKAGIPIKCTPHTLRRTFATNLYNQSSDIYLTSTALGHKSVETTKKAYAKVAPEKLAQIVGYSKNLIDDRKE